MVTETFSKWARGFSGCDGGNIKGKIWLCGIEYAGGDSCESIAQELSRDVSHPPPPREKPESFLSYRYNQGALKILCALSGKYGDKYEDFFRSESCFAPDSDYFKLNLYPLGFRTVDSLLWQGCHSRLTGFGSKEEYQCWCRTHRFPQLRAWATQQQHPPKLILCTGKTYGDDFFSAFGNRESQTQDERAGKPIRYLVTNDGQTLVAVTYFPGGRHGLNSNEKLSSTGQRLAQILRDHGLG